MRAPAAAALTLLLAIVLAVPAAAQSRPQIPNSELPGRERDRFFDRFPKPDSLRNDPGIRWQEPARAEPRSRCRIKGTERYVRC